MPEVGKWLKLRWVEKQNEVSLPQLNEHSTEFAEIQFLNSLNIRINIFHTFIEKFSTKYLAVVNIPICYIDVTHPPNLIFISESSTTSGFHAKFKASYWRTCFISKFTSAFSNTLCFYCHKRLTHLKFVKFWQVMIRNSHSGPAILAFTNNYTKPVIWALKTNAIRRLAAFPTSGVIPPCGTVQVSHNQLFLSLPKIPQKILQFIFIVSLK